MGAVRRNRLTCFWIRNLADWKEELYECSGAAFKNMQPDPKLTRRKLFDAMMMMMRVHCSDGSCFDQYFNGMVVCDQRAPIFMPSLLCDNVYVLACLQESQRHVEGTCSCFWMGVRYTEQPERESVCVCVCVHHTWMNAGEVVVFGRVET